MKEEEEGEKEEREGGKEDGLVAQQSTHAYQDCGSESESWHHKSLEFAKSKLTGKGTYISRIHGIQERRSLVHPSTPQLTGSQHFLYFLF